MLVLEKNKINKLVFTGLEKANPAIPFIYLIGFTNQITGETKYVTGPEASTSTVRYNQLDVSLGMGDSNNGWIDLNPGLYIYTVNQVPTQLAAIQSPNQLVETGYAYVVGEDEPVIIPKQFKDNEGGIPVFE